MGLCRHKFRQLRESLDLTQEEVAQAIGKTQSHVSQFENGAKGLDLDYSKTIDLARILQCSPEDLMED